jgi:dihydroorotate dehydrogenase
MHSTICTSIHRENKLLISSGGVSTGKDMYERMASGANLVQIFSELIINGPYVAKSILEEFSDILDENNETAQSVIGKYYQEQKLVT